MSGQALHADLLSAVVGVRFRKEQSRLAHSSPLGVDREMIYSIRLSGLKTLT